MIGLCAPLVLPEVHDKLSEGEFCEYLSNMVLAGVHDKLSEYLSNMWSHMLFCFRASWKCRHKSKMLDTSKIRGKVMLSSIPLPLS